MNNFDFGEEMKKRTKAFAAQIIRFYKHLPKRDEARALGRQILCWGSSVAADYRAVGRAKSQADFVSKTGTVVEGSDESRLWRELFEAAEAVSGGKLKVLKEEAEELLRIFSKSLNTARRS
jgi:four helix bundle protein